MFLNNKNRNILRDCIFRLQLWTLKKTSSFLEVYKCFEGYVVYYSPSFLPAFPSAFAFSILAF